MSWARFDDRFWSNRKVRRAWKLNRACIGLHVMACTYCAMHETDGSVDEELVEQLLPNPKERAAAVEALLTAGLWDIESEAGMFVIHDYLDYNPSSEEAANLRSTRSEAGKRGAAARWHPDSNRLASANGKPIAKAMASAMPTAMANADHAAMAKNAPVPTPTPKGPPIPPKGGRQRERQRYEDDVQAYAASLLPDVPQDFALHAIRQALHLLAEQGGTPTNAEVLELASRLRSLPDSIRQLIHTAATAA